MGPMTSPESRRHQQRGGPGGHSPRLHTYHHHLQKPWAEPISFFWRYSWSPEILIVVILCQSVSQQLLCLHVEDLTRQKGNHAKSKPTPTNTKAGTRQKQTDESLNNQSKVVHEYLFTWGPWRHQRACDVTNRGGVQGGHFPPASHVPPSPPEAQGGADFILLEVTPKARQPLFFWRLLLKPGSPYSFGGYS